jgi:hypothetical protein
VTPSTSTATWRERRSTAASCACPCSGEASPSGASPSCGPSRGPFPDRQLALLGNFAEQAVIAIENARLFQELGARNAELTESLAPQTATGEILGVIARSPTDIQRVLDTVAESAARLCDALDAAIFRVDSDRLRLVAHHGSIPAGAIGEFTVSLNRGTVLGRSAEEARSVHIADIQVETGVSRSNGHGKRRPDSSCST